MASSRLAGGSGRGRLGMVGATTFKLASTECVVVVAAAAGAVGAVAEPETVGLASLKSGWLKVTPWTEKLAVAKLAPLNFTGLLGGWMGGEAGFSGVGRSGVVGVVCYGNSCRRGNGCSSNEVAE